MTITAQSAQLTDWQCRPLCCRYFMAHFGALTTKAREEGIACDLTVHWALGALADGECEVLGLWLETPSGVTPLQRVFDDLKVRGVETIRFVATIESTDVHATFPDATVLPSLGQLLRQAPASMAPRDRMSVVNALHAVCAAETLQAVRAALDDLSSSPLGARYPAILARWRAALAQLAPYYALAPRLRRVMLSTEEAAQQVHASLSRAVGKHGCFADPEAAVAFMSQALERSERGLSAGLSGLPPNAVRRASVLTSGSGAAALAI